MSAGASLGRALNTVRLGVVPDRRHETLNVS